ncbi:hypothetical protein BJ944DRAFT_268559 [Cunninghamella echinulata]|nr:hypothetical protein BJ944DRAFT_268559 [Cunninghamella echinulata]
MKYSKNIIYIISILLLAFTKYNYALDDGIPPTGNSVLGRTIHKPTKCVQASTNARIELHYTARQWNTETYFENTYETGVQKYTFGYDKMMKGLEQGIQGMCEKEIRRLLIPADLAYGEIGLPGYVDPDTAIIMDVELISVKSPFKNPWFWAGALALITIFFAMQRSDYLKTQASASNFIAQKKNQ